MSNVAPRLPSRAPQVGGRFWLRWVAASVIGALPGLALAYAYATAAGGPLLTLLGGQSPYTGWVTIVMLLAPGALLGLGTGSAQVLASAGRLGPTWLFANVAGYSVLWCGIVAADRYGVFRFEYMPFSVAVLGLLLFVVMLCLVLPQRVLVGRLYAEEWLDWAFSNLEVTICIIGVPVIVMVLLLQGVWQTGLTLPAVGVLAGAGCVQVVAAGLALSKTASMGRLSSSTTASR